MKLPRLGWVDKRKCLSCWWNGTSQVKGSAVVSRAKVSADGRGRVGASFSRAPMRLICRPSTSPSQPSRRASAMRAWRLSRISTSRGRWMGSVYASGLADLHHRRFVSVSWPMGHPGDVRTETGTRTLRPYMCDDRDSGCGSPAVVRSSTASMGVAVGGRKIRQADGKVRLALSLPLS